MHKAVFLVTLCLTSGSAFAANQQIVLGGTRGSVMLRSEIPAFDTPSIPPAERVCESPNGEQAEVLDTILIAKPELTWLRVRVTTGPCANAIGWVNATNSQPQ